MRSVFCTLFNQKYLDKGLVLYDSLMHVCDSCTIYVLAMDDICYQVLSNEKLDGLVPISLKEFETERLLEAKNNRSFGEYCWTCSSSLLKFVLLNKNENICTYIDADMYFYSDPSIIISDLLNLNKSVLVTGHRFNWHDKYKANVVGKYCVEFNTFTNDNNSLRILDEWIDSCLQCCKAIGDGVHWGDQMYINDWPERYDFVIETQYLGAGVAPWNVSQYKYVDSEGGNIRLKCKGQIIELVYYHFENIQFINEKLANINAISTWNDDIRFIRRLYSDYLRALLKKREYLLSKYNVNCLIKFHPVLGNVKPSILGRLFKATRKLIKVNELKNLLFSGIPKNLFSRFNIIQLNNE